MLAIIMQIILRAPSIIIIGIPIIIKIKGIARTTYKTTDNWKLREFLPLILTHTDSSRRVSQQITGPIMFPNGKKKPAKAER